MSHIGEPLNTEDKELSSDQQKFAELLEKYDYAFNRGDIITGTVISIESNGLLVDIGAKMAAFLPNKEINHPHSPDDERLETGKEYEFYIFREEDEEGQLKLSRKRVFLAQNWSKLEELHASETPVEVTITAVVKGGLLVDVFGLRGFIPFSHLRVKEPVDDLVGQKLTVKILTLEQSNNNIILSHRKIVSEQMAEQRKELFANLETGNIVEGEVVRLTDFGAFIDLGGLDGLLPLSQMSWRWVEHPSDILKIGDTVKVEVIGIDHEKQRVSLSIKSQFNDPWNEVRNKLDVGHEVEGTITRLKHFGAFVEVYPGVEALLPSKDLMEYENANNTKLDMGDKIKTFIVKFTPEERRISLSFHPNEGEAQYQPEAAAKAD